MELTNDQADAAILVANCPVCHQTMTLIARHLEDAGLSTVIMGCAKDIVEHAGAPRFVFSDFPLGNAAGKPHNKPSQENVLDLALKTLEMQKRPETTINPDVWNEDHSWKLDYSNPDILSKAELSKRRLAFDAQKQAARKAK